MIRDPSIHVRESDLKKIMAEVLSDHGLPDGKYTVNKLVLDLITRAKEYSANHRTMLVTNDRMEKAAKKIITASSGDTMLMAKTIYQVRRSMRHKGVMMAKAGSRDWSLIKDIANHAVEFCQDFELGKKEGFIAYIKTAVGKMSKFGLTQIPSKHEQICADYEASQNLQSDNNPFWTERCYKMYNKMIIEQLGYLITDYKDTPGEYMYFMQASQKCKEYNVTPEQYIQAQFHGLQWTNGIPSPSQLVSAKAPERLQKYLMEKKNTTNNDEPRQVDTSMVSRLSKIKSLK